MQELRKYLAREGWAADWKETKRDVQSGLEAVVHVVQKPLDLYKNNKYVNVNANVIAASYPSIQAAVSTSCVMRDTGYCDGAIAGGAAAAEWTAYLPVHIGLHYLSNRKKFRRDDGKLDQKEFWKDVGRVYLTQIPSIALFYAMAVPLQYGLMKAGMEADTSNLVSYWGTLIATRTLHTYNYWKLNNRLEKKGAKK